MMINGKSVEESFVDLASSFSELAKLVTAALVSKMYNPVEPAEVDCELQDIPEECRTVNVIEEDDLTLDDEGAVFAADLDTDGKKLEAIENAAYLISTHAGLNDYPIPSDPKIACEYLSAFEKADIPRWKYKHIHITPGKCPTVDCVDAAYNSGGLHAAASCVARLVGRHVEDEFIITRSKLEEDLIDVGILSNSDYLVDLDSLLKVLGTDYTIKLIPGVCDLLSLIDSDDCGNVSVISALTVLEKAAANIWGVYTVPCGLRMLRVALNMAAANKEAELARLIADKFGDEIKEGKEFVTLPQAESITGKTATEIARMLGDSANNSKLRLVECQRGGNLFVIDKSMLVDNNSDNIRD
jgi:hypothetical protein